MLKKSFLLVLLAGLFLFVGLSCVVMAADQGAPVDQNCGWTNMRFAEFLGQKNGIKLDANLPDNDKYKALANALSQKGISYFQTAKPTDLLTCCGAADALYASSGGKDAGSTCNVKIDYLIKNGALKSGIDPCVALCNPAETFTPVVERLNTNPPGETPEKPAS
jgi:hypothetical protein